MALTSLKGPKVIGLMTALALICAGCGSSSGSSHSSAKVAGNCKPRHHFSTISSGYLTVVTTPYPPYAEIKDGKLWGIEGVLVNKLAAEECLKVKVVSAPDAAEIPDVIGRRADMTIGDFYRSAPRAKVTGLTNPLFVDQMAIASKSGITTVAGLKGQTIGSTEGYLWDTQMATMFGSAFTLYPSDSDVYSSLKSGRLTVALDGFGAASYAVKTGHIPVKVEVAKPDSSVPASEQPAQAGWPYVKSNTGLGAAVNADIAAMHKNGEIADALAQFGVPRSGAKTGPPRLVAG